MVPTLLGATAGARDSRRFAPWVPLTRARQRAVSRRALRTICGVIFITRLTEPIDHIATMLLNCWIDFSRVIKVGTSWADALLKSRGKYIKLLELTNDQYL